MNAPTYADAQYALARAVTGFEERLRAVRSQDWQRPTPCEGWTVSDLVKHLVGGGIMSELLLNGGVARGRDDGAVQP
jgi:uncharacterized protein (TIGR03083 family)